MNEEDFEDVLEVVVNPVNRVYDYDVVSSKIGPALWRQLERPVVVEVRRLIGSRIAGRIETVTEKE